MIRFIALALAASGLAAAAIPGPGTYTISQGNQSLGLGKSKGNVLFPQSNAADSAQQWVLESTSGSSCGTFNVKNAKFGTYLGYPPNNVRSWDTIKGVDKPVEFTLFPGSNPDEFHLVSKDRMGVNIGPGGRLPPPGQERSEIVLRSQDGREKPWVFKKVSARAGAAKPQESCSPN
ncbi:hypothetical protein FRC09_008918 [Ceratobasidium sp. 395]|nr:hypothetical protein FRC09_008918 [Ceratobasidium sp. 395]